MISRYLFLASLFCISHIHLGAAGLPEQGMEIVIDDGTSSQKKKKSRYHHDEDVDGAQELNTYGSGRGSKRGSGYQTFPSYQAGGNHVVNMEGSDEGYDTKLFRSYVKEVRQGKLLWKDVVLSTYLVSLKNRTDKVRADDRLAENKANDMIDLLDKNRKMQKQGTFRGRDTGASGGQETHEREMQLLKSFVLDVVRTECNKKMDELLTDEEEKAIEDTTLMLGTFLKAQAFNNQSISPDALAKSLQSINYVALFQGTVRLCSWMFGCSEATEKKFMTGAYYAGIACMGAAILLNTAVSLGLIGFGDEGGDTYIIYNNGTADYSSIGL